LAADYWYCRRCHSGRAHRLFPGQVADSPRKPLEHRGLISLGTDDLGMSTVELRRILTARTAGGGVQFTAQPRTPLGGRVGIDIIRLPLPSKFPKYCHISWYLSWQGGVPSERGRQPPLKHSPPLQSKYSTPRPAATDWRGGPVG